MTPLPLGRVPPPNAMTAIVDEGQDNKCRECKRELQSARMGLVKEGFVCCEGIQVEVPEPVVKGKFELRRKKGFLPWEGLRRRGREERVGG